MTEEATNQPAPGRRVRCLAWTVVAIPLAYVLSFSYFYVFHAHEFSKALEGDPYQYLIVFSKRNTELHMTLRALYSPLIALTSDRRHVLTREEHETTKWIWDSDPVVVEPLPVEAPEDKTGAQQKGREGR